MDSLQLLRMQGGAFTEALAQAAESAMASESFVDYLIHLRYAEVVRNVTRHDLANVSDQQLVRTAVEHDLFGLFVLDSTATLTTGGVTRGPASGPPQFVFDEAAQLLSQPEHRYVLLLDEGDDPGEIIHYYLELTNDLRWVVVLAADASYYIEALRETQIGYLTQNMAREEGVEYIIYQSTEGIIFSSRKTGQLLAIESDPFLTESLDSDSIRYRTYEFQQRQVLELVRPFASEDYPFGLLRVGISLEGYNTVSRSFDRLMLSLAAVMFGLILVGLLYLRSRRKRRELSERYSRIKTTTDRIFDEMRTGVAVVDHHGIVTLVNAAFESVFGVSNMLGRQFSSVVSEPQLDHATTGSGRGTSTETEIMIERKGAAVHLLAATSALQFDGAETAGTVIVVYDVTRLKQFEREAVRRERLSEMGHLAAGVAHEIRNPLNTISIAAQRLAGEFTPEQNQQEYSGMTSQIKEEATRLNEIITRFLALAREEKKRFQPIALDSFIEEFVHFITPEAEQLGIELSVDLVSGCTIQADDGNLKQVFTNLFNNAKEALNKQPGHVRIRTESTKDKVQILLADSGPGIKESIREKVFAPYFTTKDAGTGLGLPTVHKIISEMGGEITIADSDLGGAEFVITLPVQK
ncbi:MAG: ATP-binding protein [candidate division Zixibacteria bacterium]|nr:ATP-binding protein [candidate division Zixibacteria bacterium]MDH3936270.1 ATP-binding protein [candidate division Zixibacteria bacterium]